jgi:hypothetical protein
MGGTMDKLIAGAVTLLVGAFAGYLAGYMKEKGKNLATHEDIDKLIAQVSAITKTTKDIEAKISNETWEWQKRWELKRDQIFQIATKAAAAKDALIDLHSTGETEQHARDKGLPERPETLGQVMAAWSLAGDALELTLITTGLVCSIELFNELSRFVIFTRGLASKIMDGDSKAFEREQAEFADRYGALAKAMQAEIKYIAPPTSRSNEFSGTPTPGSPTPAADTQAHR